MNIQEKTSNKLISIIVLLFSVAAYVSPVAAESIIVPIKLDYQLLRHLMLSQLFNTVDHSREILQDPSGCSRIILSDPDLREQRKNLEIATHVKAEIGTGILGTCTHMFSWEGDAKFLTEPVILSGERSVRLNILATRLYNQQGQLINSGPFWDLADGQLQSFLSRYEVDLAPSINELSNLMPEILNRHSDQQIKKIIQSLRLARLEVLPDSINVDISLQIDRLLLPSKSEAVLSEKELQQLEEKWQMMDAMITHAVKYSAAATSLKDVREVLLEILLDARYRLKDALSMPVSHSDDPVRHWFIDTWIRMGPVLRQISLDTPGQEPMLIISLITATNALDALDRLGPTLGLDISADGLRRMGRMLINQPGVDPLRYEDGVDPELRHLFQLPSSLQPTRQPGALFNLWPIRSAWATNNGERLNLWVPRKNELKKYLPEIRNLLIDSAKNSATVNELDAATAQIYQYLVLTTAWQESCWRQYVVEKKKIVPLRSHTGDSGLMQMNERVWRGFYNTQKLRWDIDYNAQAGAEVLMQYLIKYALKREEHKRSGGLDNLARAAYSAYNGGPGQTSRYRNPKAAASLKKIDSAFWKKYQAVKQGKEMQVAQCLGGNTDDIAVVTQNKIPSTKTPTPKTNQRASKSNTRVGKDWILAQDKTHYTLQLAVFSSKSAADKFRVKSNLQGIIAVAPLSKDKQGKFVVIAGSYTNKSAANRQKQRYKNLKPWVRQFDELQKIIKK